MAKATGQAGGKFNFRVKIVQTDLSGRYFLRGADAGGDYMTYQNSSYISKLYHINNYSGGILAKEKIEDMPERYRRFITFDDPSDEQLIKNFMKDIITLASREEVGQNVFYNRLTNPEILDGANITDRAGKTASAGNLHETEYAQAKTEPRKNLESLAGLEDFAGLESFEVFDGFESFESFLGSGSFEDFFFADGGEADGNFEGRDGYENYRDDEEIRDILHLNNYYMSDADNICKTEYDFSSPGTISVKENGSLEIRYDESEMTGLKDSFIQFFFNPENKDIVTVRRKSFFDIWFSLEKGRRISIEQRGRCSGVVLTTNTKELVNKMTAGGGEMRFVYINETDGVPSEMIVHSICAAPAGADFSGKV